MNSPSQTHPHTHLRILTMIDSMAFTQLVSSIMNEFTEVVATSMFVTSLETHLYSGPLLPPRYQLFSGTFLESRLVLGLLIYLHHLEYNQVHLYQSYHKFFSLFSLKILWNNSMVCFLVDWDAHNNPIYLIKDTLPLEGRCLLLLPILQPGGNLLLECSYLLIWSYKPLIHLSQVLFLVVLHFSEWLLLLGMLPSLFIVNLVNPQFKFQPISISRISLIFLLVNLSKSHFK